MAHEQIEYCGSCKNYTTCIKLEKEGRFTSCKMNIKEEAKQDEELS